MGLTQKSLDNRFTYHQPKNNSVAAFVQIRQTAKNLAELINNQCPDSREMSLAITKLEECVFWANASITRYQEDEGDG
jgi:uncharacterized membrane protein affecting hemolysin expression